MSQGKLVELNCLLAWAKTLETDDKAGWPHCTLSGSDQRRSQSSPWSGTSVGLMILLICSMDWRSGLRPPWQQKIFSSTMAATGRQLKQSVNVFHSFMLYLRLPEGTNKELL